jgi:hypothetical protein
MKPISVYTPSSPEIKKLLEYFKKETDMPTKSSISMGEVADGYYLPGKKLLELFPRGLQLIKSMGYQLASDYDDYDPVEFVVTKSNVDIHTDVLGTIALMLLKVETLCTSSAVSIKNSMFSSESYLWTKGELTKMEMGTMSIFNANKQHAWFCSGVATFLSIPVKKLRKQKQQPCTSFE